MVNTRPLRRTKTIMEYAHVLFDRFALEYFRAGVQEVHLIFDKPGRQTFNPKQFEHAKRYTKGKSCNQHEHISFTPQTSIPQGWQEYLECRECKRSIVEVVGLSFLQKGQLFLTGCQNVVIAGCLSGEGENNAWAICSSEAIAEPLPQYQSNAEEADNRIWRHAIQSWATNILIYSPDTDVYNIGLGLITQTIKQYIIQLNVPQAAEKRYLLLNNLHTALLNDPDLASVSRDSIGITMQTLFITTGCDFVSYFKSLGKATVLNIFFQHAEFICGANMPGCLHHTLPHNRESGFLAFIRFIGTCYFKKHLPAFITLYGHETPKHLYNSIDSSLQSNVKHKLWLKKIRNAVTG